MQTLGFSPEARCACGHGVARRCWASSSASFAIRRQGIYFAMVTLALAQMVYFVFLQAPFTHGEDGLQGVPRGKLFGVLDLSSDVALYFVVLADDGARVPADRADRAFAVRSGARRDQGERAARGVARLRYRPLQVAGLHSVGAGLRDSRGR